MAAQKEAHVDSLDELPFTREEHVLATTLKGLEIALEKNLFPYDCPPGIEVIQKKNNLISIASL